jgi:hypothetical protein
MEMFGLDLKKGPAFSMQDGILAGLFLVIAFLFILRLRKNAIINENTDHYINTRRSELSGILSQTDALLKSRKAMPSYIPIDEKDLNSERIRQVLSKLEALAYDVRIGLVSETYVRDNYYSSVVDTFDFVKKYMHQYRLTRNHTTAFQNYECLYVRLTSKRLSIIQVLVEFVTNKPMFQLSLFLFRLKYMIAAAFTGSTSNYLREETETVRDLMFYVNIIVYILYVFAALVLYRILHILF